MKTKTVLALVVAAVAILPLWWLAIDGRSRVSEVQGRIEASDVPDYVRVGARIFTRAYDESEAAWSARVGRIVRGEELLEGQYLCTLLTGCDVPGGEIEVCTYCNANPPSPACEARHAASVAAFCAEFDCTDCDG